MRAVGEELALPHRQAPLDLLDDVVHRLEGGTAVVGAHGHGQGGLPDAELAALDSAGGIILLSLGLTMTGIRKLPVVDVLPALVLAPAAVWLVSLL